MGKDVNNSAAKVNIAATFTDNLAVDGGVIYNTFYADNDIYKWNGIIVTGTFTENSVRETPRRAHSRRGCFRFHEAPRHGHDVV